MCQSSDPDGDPLSYFFTFGDGATASGSCIETHTYAAGPFRAASAGGAKALDSSYNFDGSAVDPGGLSQTRTRTVVVTKPAPPPTTPACAAPPAPTITDPVDGTCSFSNSVDVAVTASDPQGISNVTVKGIFRGTATGTGTCTATAPVTEDSQTATGTAPNFGTTLTLIRTVGLAKCYDFQAIVTNSCGSQSNSKVTYYLASGGCYPYPYFRDLRGALAWSSDLDVEGGSLQLVVNGSSAYPGAGRAYGMAALSDGQNHVEATLVEGRGKAGLWRFDFMSTQSIEPGSIRVVAGDIASVAASSVTFHIKGIPGERIAFTFDRK
jgi:hypothetical protein